MKIEKYIFIFLLFVVGYSIYRAYTHQDTSLNSLYQTGAAATDHWKYGTN